MTSAKKIQIYGKTYSLKTSSAEVTTEEVAAYVDAKMHELADARSKSSTLDIAILAALNIAQELLELQKLTHASDEAQEEKISRLLATLDKELHSIEN